MARTPYGPGPGPGPAPAMPQMHPQQQQQQPPPMWMMHQHAASQQQQQQPYHHAQLPPPHQHQMPMSGIPHPHATVAGEQHREPDWQRLYIEALQKMLAMKEEKQDMEQRLLALERDVAMLKNNSSTATYYDNSTRTDERTPKAASKRRQSSSSLIINDSISAYNDHHEAAAAAAPAPRLQQQTIESTPWREIFKRQWPESTYEVLHTPAFQSKVRDFVVSFLQMKNPTMSEEHFALAAETALNIPVILVDEFSGYMKVRVQKIYDDECEQRSKSAVKVDDVRGSSEALTTASEDSASKRPKLEEPIASMAEPIAPPPAPAAESTGAVDNSDTMILEDLLEPIVPVVIIDDDDDPLIEGFSLSMDNGTEVLPTSTVANGGTTTAAAPADPQLDAEDRAMIDCDVIAWCYLVKKKFSLSQSRISPNMSRFVRAFLSQHNAKIVKCRNNKEGERKSQAIGIPLPLIGNFLNEFGENFMGIVNTSAGSTSVSKVSTPVKKVVEGAGGAFSAKATSASKKVTEFHAMKAKEQQQQTEQQNVQQQLTSPVKKDLEEAPIEVVQAQIIPQQPVAEMATVAPAAAPHITSVEAFEDGPPIRYSDALTQLMPKYRAIPKENMSAVKKGVKQFLTVKLGADFEKYILPAEGNKPKSYGVPQWLVKEFKTWAHGQLSKYYPQEVFNVD